VSLTRFPQRTLRGATEIYRIRWSGKSPWWFSADGSGRFDPVGTGQGACYFAGRPVGAWVEVFRKTMLLAEDEVLERALYRAKLGRDLRLADVTSRRALQFGITASIGAGEDYTESHAFAVDAVAAGFAGVRYLVRHDPAQRLYGFALFGRGGESGPVASPGGLASADDPIPDDVVGEARRLFDYRVLPTP
jgi:RES domain-containing protein